MSIVFPGEINILPKFEKIFNLNVGIAAGAFVDVWTPLAGRRIIPMGMYLGIVTTNQVIVQVNAVTKINPLVLANNTIVLNFAPNGLDAFLANHVLRVGHNAGIVTGVWFGVWGHE